MAQRIVVDPIPRIEGHLRIEVEVQDGKVKDAWSSGMLFRGLEIILQGRDPRDAWLFTQRACGVCTYVHASASIRAVDNAVGVEIPPNARIIRNLMMASQFIHDHCVHFYHLHALDWVDVVSALSADPKATADLANAISNRPRYGVKDFVAVQEKLKAFVDSGQLGIFANAYWGHPAYKLPPEANLMATAHYLYALDMQARMARMHAIWGGKNPHLQSLYVGGVTSGMDMNADRISEYLYLLDESIDFVENIYIPDLLAVASFYKDWGAIGGCTNYLAYGEFPETGEEPESLYMPRGVITNKHLGTIDAAMLGNVTEDVTRGWYEDGPALPPARGKRNPSPPIRKSTRPASIPSSRRLDTPESRWKSDLSPASSWPMPTATPTSNPSWTWSLRNWMSRPGHSSRHSAGPPQEGSKHWPSRRKLDPGSTSSSPTSRKVTTATARIGRCPNTPSEWV